MATRSIFFLRQSSIQPGLRHIERYVETALREHRSVALTVFDLVTEVRNVAVPGVDRVETIRRYHEYAVDRIAHVRPEAVLVMNGFAVDSLFPGFFARVKDRGIRVIAWHADDPYYFDLQEPLAVSFDTVLTVDSSCVPLWKSRVRAAEFLPLAFAPGNTERLWDGVDRSTYASDVCFVGTPFAGSRRVRIIDENADFLAGLNFRLAGANRIDSWRAGLRNFPALESRTVDTAVDPVEMLRYSMASKINLNLHKDSFGHAWDRNTRRIVAQSPNERFFALAGAGAFQLVDDSRPDLPRLFPDDAPALFAYDSNESFRVQIRCFLDHPSEAGARAERLCRIVRAAHTYRHRVDRILEILGGP